MRRKAASVVAAGVAAVLLLAAGAAAGNPPAHAGPPADHVLTIDHGVPHVSTVPAIAGQHVRLFLRELVKESGGSDGHRAPPRDAVLFVHGASVPGVAAFDLAYEDYSWGRYLAEAGFDVYILELTGYGFSPRPTLDNACNASPGVQQSQLVPNPLDAPCPPEYPYTLSSIESEHAEIDAAIEFIKQRRGLERVNLIGYSLGGLRAGTYASLNPGKIDKLILWAACCYQRNGSTQPPQVPAPGYPMQIQTYDGLIYDRWLSTQSCSDQVEPGVAQAAWNQIMGSDPLGSTWGTPAWNPIASPTGGVMRYPQWQFWGWNLAAAQRITVPTLVIVGELDSLYGSNRALYSDLGARDKVFLGVACATHFATWERQHTVFREASRDWLRHGSVRGVRQGVLAVDANGGYLRQ